MIPEEWRELIAPKPMKIPFSRGKNGELVVDHVELAHLLRQHVHSAILGDVKALNLLWIMADMCARGLHLISELNPKAVREVANTVARWPVVFSHSPAIQEQAKQLIKSIELGRDYEQDDWIQSRIRRTPAKNQVALIVRWLEYIRNTGQVAPGYDLPVEIEPAFVALEPLDRSNYRAWMKALRLFLQWVTRGHPERRVQLRALGIAKGNRDTAKPGTRSSESNIRAEIYVKLESALKSYARHPVAYKAGLKTWDKAMEEFVITIAKPDLHDIPSPEVSRRLNDTPAASLRGEKKKEQ